MAKKKERRFHLLGNTPGTMYAFSYVAWRAKEADFTPRILVTKQGTLKLQFYNRERGKWRGGLGTR